METAQPKTVKVLNMNRMSLWRTFKVVDDDFKSTVTFENSALSQLSHVILGPNKQKSN